MVVFFFFFFSSRRRHTRSLRDWSSDVCSSDLGEPAPRLSDRDAWRSRVACVYQKSTIIPELSVAENLFLNRQETRRGLVRWPSVRRAATELLARWSVDVDVRRPAGELSIEQRQFVEIA